MVSSARNSEPFLRKLPGLLRETAQYSADRRPPTADRRQRQNPDGEHDLVGRSAREGTSPEAAILTRQTRSSVRRMPPHRPLGQEPGGVPLRQAMRLSAAVRCR